jgi:hypothetical protein
MINPWVFKPNIFKVLYICTNHFFNFLLHGGIEYNDELVFQEAANGP